MNSPALDTAPKPVVCHVLHSLCVGGAEMLAKQFAERSRECVTSVFACLDDLGELGAQLHQQGHVVEVLDRRPGFDFGLTRRLAAFWRQHEVSVVHAHQYAPFFYSALARAPRRRPPIIFTEHGRHFPDLRSPKRVIANKFLLATGDRVAAVGEQVKRALVENEGISPNRIEVVYNGVSLQQFAEPNCDRQTARQRLGIAASGFAVIQVARLNPLKDHQTAVAAMAELVRRHPEAQLWIVGEGEQRSAIQQAIAAAGLEKSVWLLGNRHDIPLLLRAADAFLLTSVSEGIPLTLIEAMVSGLPCVATSVGGIPEVIIDGESGLLASAKDASALAAHLSRLIEVPGYSEEIAQQGRQRAVREFDDRSMHRWYQNAYLALAGG